jgi:hypothetical protein
MSLARRKNRYSYLVKSTPPICSSPFCNLCLSDQSVRLVLLGLRPDLRPGHHNHHRHPHEPSADPEGVRLHPENAYLHLLLGLIRIPRPRRRRDQVCVQFDAGL